MTPIGFPLFSPDFAWSNLAAPILTALVAGLGILIARNTALRTMRDKALVDHCLEVKGETRKIYEALQEIVSVKLHTLSIDMVMNDVTEKAEALYRSTVVSQVNPKFRTKVQVIIRPLRNLMTQDHINNLEASLTDAKREMIQLEDLYLASLLKIDLEITALIDRKVYRSLKKEKP